MKKYIYIVMISFLFLGCSKQPAQPTQQAKIPSWYLQAPKNNANFLYGTGESYDKQEAKANALSDMSSRLVVAVGSSMSMKTKSSTLEGFSNDVSRDVKVEAKKIKFTNAIIDKIQAANGNIYVLMKVNKKELYKSKHKDFIAQDNRINAQYKTLKTKSALEQIFALQDLKPMLVKSKSKAIVLQALNNAFDSNSYIKKYNSHIDEIAKLKSSITVSIKSNNKNNFFLDVVSKTLNEDSYQISKNNSSIQINLSNNIRYSKARNWHIAKVSTTIAVKTGAKTLSNQIVNSLGRSTSTKVNALNGASMNFEKRVREIGLNNILFKR